MLITLEPIYLSIMQRTLQRFFVLHVGEFIECSLYILYHHQLHPRIFSSGSEQGCIFLDISHNYYQIVVSNEVCERN